MSLSVSAPIAAIGALSVRSAAKQEQAIAGVSAALNSMGDAAGFTLSQLRDMAATMQDNSLYGDEDILSKVTANLLTFGKIHTTVFERAQKLSLDLSARLGQDLQSSAVMLGKALNDPVLGLTALSRVGITFTEQQKAMIKEMAAAGDVIGAQTIMLEELERQYSGQAAALANIDSGRLTQAMNSIGDAMEKVGAIMLPILADIADYIKRMAEKFQMLDPKTQKFIVAVGAIGAAAGPVIVTLGIFAVAISAISGPILLVVGAAAALGAGLFALTGTTNETAMAAEAAKKAENDLKAAVSGAASSMPGAARQAITLAQTRVELAKASLQAAEAELQYRQDVMSNFSEGFPILDAAFGGMGDIAVSQAETALATRVTELQEARKGLREVVNIAINGDSVGGGATPPAQDGPTDEMIAKFDQLAESLDPALAAMNTYDEVVNQLNESLRSGVINQDEYNKYLALADERLASVTETSNGAASGIAGVGGAAREAAGGLADAANEAESFAGSIGGAIGNGLSGVFDDFLAGTLDARAAVSGLFADLAKMAMNSLFKDLLAGLNGGAGSDGGFLGGLFGSLSGARAAGGPVTAGQSYLVGEFRPEIFVPNVSGNIIPDADLGAATGAGAAPNVSLKNINVFDPSIVGDYLSTSAGERLMVNVMRKNAI
ncbi:MAG: phage tail length tape measure family protein [Rhodobacteraceae bacterium]|nr:phage tail length tape measure family protein [Paracoccaceae bacterium]